MRIANDVIFTAGVMTGTTAINSSAVWLGHIALVGFQVYWTKTGGTLTGTFKVQVSNDDVPNASGQALPNTAIITNWTDVPNATLAVVDAASGTGLITLIDTPYKWARVVYTNATGTGLVSGRFNAKGF